MEQRGFFSRMLIFIAMLLLALTFLFPLFYLTNNSLKTVNEYFLNPFSIKLIDFQIENYRIMISQFKIFRYFWNTGLVVVISCVLILIFSVFASYAFAKLRFKGKNFIFMFIIATMLIPAQVTIIPLYILFSKVNLINNLWSVILINLAGMLPGNILLMTTYFKGISNEMIEAAKIDGGNYFHIVRNVIVPMGIPVIVIQFIFNSKGVWNDFLVPMILLQKNDVKTIMPALTALVQRYVSDQPYQYAGLVLSCIPPIILYMIFQKYIIKGMTVGSIK